MIPVTASAPPLAQYQGIKQKATDAMTQPIQFRRPGPSALRKSLIAIALYIACVVGGVALAHLAGTPTAAIPGPGTIATG